MKKFFWVASLALTVLLSSPLSAQEKAVITKNGVGPVVVGKNYTIEDVLNRCKLPETYASLYDEMLCDRNQFSGDFEIVCYLDGAISLLVFSDEDDKVNCFTVVTDQVKTSDGLSTASTAAEILAAGGKVQNMPMKENNRVVGYSYRMVKDGVYFLFRQADVVGGKVKSDAKPYGISNTLYGGVTEDELDFM